jgi:hypothetical protein
MYEQGTKWHIPVIRAKPMARCGKVCNSCTMSWFPERAGFKRNRVSLRKIHKPTPRFDRNKFSQICVSGSFMRYCVCNPIGKSLWTGVSSIGHASYAHFHLCQASLCTRRRPLEKGSQNHSGSKAIKGKSDQGNLLCLLCGHEHVPQPLDKSSFIVAIAHWTNYVCEMTNILFTQHTQTLKALLVAHS